MVVFLARGVSFKQRLVPTWGIRAPAEVFVLISHTVRTAIGASVPKMCISKC